MAEEVAIKTESQSQSGPVDSSPPPPPPPLKENDSEKEDHPNGVAQQLGVPAPAPTQKSDSSSFHKAADPETKRDSWDSVDRDSVYARVETEKRLALIKAWEESEKTKAENRAYKKNSTVGLWEDTKRAAVEVQLKKIEEKMEKKKAEYVEKMRNKIAEIHQSAEEKRAMVEAQRREEFLKAEETASKFRASGYTPRKFLLCFGG